MVHKGGIGAKSPQRAGCCDGTLGVVCSDITLAGAVGGLVL